MLTPIHFMHCQFAILKGLSPSHIRRFLYNLLLQRLQRGGGVAILKTDQSNAYGQTDRDALAVQENCDPILRWVCLQSVTLYTLPRALVVTAHRLTDPYRIAGGLVQGGGMDPLLYVLYTVLLFVALRDSSKGVRVQLVHTEQRVRTIAVVDDTMVLESSVEEMQQTANEFVQTVRKLNGKINPDKYGLLVVRPSARDMLHAVPRRTEELVVEGHTVKAVGQRTEMRIGGKGAHADNTSTKMVGGNTNILTRTPVNLAEVRKWAHILRCKVKANMPTLWMLLVAGFVLSRWSYRKMVDWPTDAVCNGESHGHRPAETTAVTSCVANLVLKSLYLPLATPWEFLFGDPAKGCLGIRWPADRQWWTAVAQMLKCARSCHPWVRETTLPALQGSTFHDTVDGDKRTDYAILKWWMQSVGWSMEIVVNHGDLWAIVLPNFSSMWQILLVVGDTSTDAQQRRWGSGAVVATIEGELLCRMRAVVRAKYTSTTLLEATTVVQAAKAVREAPLCGGRGHIEIWPWCDNKSAADMLWWRHLAKGRTDFMGIVLAEAELLAVAGFQAGWCPAQHDTKSQSVISVSNGGVDDEARQAFAQPDTLEWRVQLLGGWGDPDAAT